jgi:hypothetical protein
MRKALWMIAVVMLITALGSTSALADGTDVFNADGYVIAIDDITLNGTLYNVTFTSTIDNTFSAYAYYSTTMEGIFTAIDGDLGGTPINDGTGDYYAIEAAIENAGWADNAPWFQESGYYTTGLWDDFVTDDTGTIFWANFTPAVVATPEPATAPLTLTGVGLLGLMVVMRKRHSLGHHQAT